MTTHQLPIRHHAIQLEPDFCPLLSLPKELRLEIWRYAITDPSMDHLVLCIDRDYSPCSSHERPSSKPCCNPLRQCARFRTLVKTTFEKPRNCPVSITVLRSNKLIYHEALPLLYHSVAFCPRGTKSVFPDFLSLLSHFAKQHMRRIRLCIDAYIATDHHFSWAMLCAQTASLPGLRQVEVLGSYMHCPPPSPSKERLLRPLLKIKAPKKLIPEKDDVFQKILAEAEEVMEAEKTARKEQMALQTTKRMELKHGDKNGGFTLGETSIARPTVDKHAITSRPHAGQELGDEQDAEWDIVSLGSFESELDCGPSELIPGVKRTRSQSNDTEPLLTGDDDWELIDPHHAGDDTTRG
ncbi:hypothetical protein EKO04_001473 [Ascochyta lentis]|uniref:DUF7730 domain-containing protein n=1 Tax=Ascochyta lentis TaxID=205686 RepID=A0A8H7JCP2_9PLEO|nr:hypothetical protein EKO04_001473 [Ascochyta lentis]